MSDLPSGYSLVRFAENHRAAVIALWHRCDLTRPWNDPDKDITRKLTDPVGRFLVLLHDQTPVGSAMVGYDGHRGSVYYLCVDPDHQGKGLGRALMAEIERFLIGIDCPKINLMVRDSNVAALGFYDQLGFSREQTALLGKRLIPDD